MWQQVFNFLFQHLEKKSFEKTMNMLPKIYAKFHTIKRLFGNFYYPISQLFIKLLAIITHTIAA